MSELKCPKCGADKSHKMSSQHEIVYNCNSCQYIGSTGVPFIQSDLCKKMESRKDKQNSEHKQMSDGGCPNCGAAPTDGFGAVDCGSQLSINGATVLAQSEFCRGRSDAIRELTEWRTGEPPEGVDVVLVKDIDYGTYIVMIRDSGELWSVGLGSLPWRKSFVWRPIPQ